MKRIIPIGATEIMPLELDSIHVDHNKSEIGIFLSRNNQIKIRCKLPVDKAEALARAIDVECERIRQGR